MSSVVPEGWSFTDFEQISSNRKIKFQPEIDSERFVYLGLEHLGVSSRKIRDFGNSVDVMSTKTKFYKGDTLFGKLRPYLRKVAYPDFDGICSTDILALSPSKNTDAEFLFYICSSDEFIANAVESSAGNIMPRASWGDLVGFPILYPPLPEQKKIASILTSVDEVIENTQKQIDKLQDLKKATMNELLTKGIGHTEFKDSELGRIPVSWEVGAISSLANFTSGFAFSSGDFSETGLLCIRMGNLYNNEFNPLRSPQYLPREFASHHPRFVVTAGDLLISMTGTAGKEDYGFLVEVPNEFNQGLLNQRVGKVIPKNQDAKAFIRELMRSRLYLEQLFSFGSGTKQANLSQSQIMGISIPIPPIDEQRLIGETVSNVSDTINALSRKLTQTQSLKKSLMQDLLTGKVRVSVN